MTALLISICIITNIHCIINLGKGYIFSKMHLFTIIHKWFRRWTQSLRVTNIDIPTKNTKVTNITIQTEQLSKLRSDHHITAKRLRKLIG